MKIIQNKPRVIFFTILFVLSLTSHVNSFGLGDLGGLVGGGGGPDLSGKQTELTGSLRDALINLGQSQAIMAEALGLDELAMLSKQNVEKMKTGDMGTTDEVEKSIETTDKANEQISAEMATGTALDAASKAKFATSIPFYIKGVLGSIKTGKAAVEVGKSIASQGPAALLKIGALISVVSNLPNLLTNLQSSTGKIMDFMTANDIDKSELDSKVSGQW
jgi:hypothetical protein